MTLLIRFHQSGDRHFKDYYPPCASAGAGGDYAPPEFLMLRSTYASRATAVIEFIKAASVG